MRARLADRRPPGNEVSGRDLLGREEGVRRRGRHMAPLFGDLADEAGEPVELRIERGAATADLQNLRLREAEHLAERGVCCQAVFAIVDLTDDEVDDLALLGLQRRFRVL